MGTETLSTSTTTGITLTSGGTYTSPFTVTTSGAIVTSADFAIYSTLAGAALTNLGTLTATVASDGVGLLLDDGGTILNSGGGLIAGHLDGVLVNGAAGTVTNAGKIGATIRDAIQLNDGGTVINTGTIAGAVAIAGAGGDRVVAGNGAVFSGTVAVAGTGNTLEFAGSGSTVASIGTQFTGFQTIAFDPGADWSIEGDAAQLAAITTINGHPGLIDLTGFAATAASYTAGVGLVLTNATGSTTLHIDAAQGYKIDSDGTGGTDIRLPYFITASTAGLTATPFNEFYVLGSGVTVTGATVDPQGLLAVGSDGTLTNLTIAAAGTQTSYYGVITNSVIYGKQIVEHGTVTNSTLYSGGVQNVYGGTVTNTSLHDGSNEIVFGGTVTNSVLFFDSNQDIYDGTVTDAPGAGTEEIHGGTVENDGSSGTDFVFGGTLTNIGTVDSNIVSGGMVTNASLVYSQTISSGTVTNEGVVYRQYLHGGTVTDVTVGYGQYVYSGGSVSGFTMLGNETIFSGGYVGNVTFGNGDTQSVYVNLGDTATVQNVLMTNGYQRDLDGVVIGTTMTGGRQFLLGEYYRQINGTAYSGVNTVGTGVAMNSTLTNVYQRLGGVLFNKTAGHNGSQYAYSYGAGKAINTEMNGGKQVIGSNIYKDIGPAGINGTFIIDGPGYALNTTFNTGTQIVHLAGTVSNTVLNNGTQDVDGGVVLGTTLNNSTQILSYGNIYYPIQVNGNFRTFVGAEIDDTVINNGSKQELSLIGPLGLNATGRAALNSLTSTTINSGGVQYVGAPLGAYAGGHIGDIANINTIYAGGKQYVRGGTTGEDNGGFSSNTTLIGGAQYVGGLGTGTAAVTAIYNSGLQVVSSGGTVVDTTLFAGGVAQVTSGGLIAGTTIDGGTLQLEQAATLGAGGTIFEPAYDQINQAVGSLVAVADGTYGGGITFANGGLLDVTAGASIVLDGAIYGFANGATIDVSSTGNLGDHLLWTQTSLANGVLSLEDAAGNVLQSFALDGAYQQRDFVLNQSGTTDMVTADIPCFCAGTRLLGLHGEIAVENIAVGDELVTVRAGGPVRRRVIWTGRRRLDTARHPHPALVRPVCIRAGAFGPGVPARDVRLSPHHAIYDDGHLFEAIALVNGRTIYQETGDRFVTYVHIELDAHDVLLADGLPAESFLDTGNRAMFEGGVTTLFPDFRHQTAANTCAPLIRTGAPLEALQARLHARADAGTAGRPLRDCSGRGV